MDSELQVNTKCPACQSTNIATVNNFRMPQKGTGVLPADFCVFECNNCGLWFKDKFPSSRALTEYYQALALSNDQWNYEDRLPHEEKLDKILKSLPKGANVLDVGCWTGRLLSTHKHVHRFGIEPNVESAEIAKKNGIHILGTTASNQSLETYKFDLITMIDVFEHLNNPFEILTILTNHLKPGGRLIVVTGRTDSFPINLVGSTYWYFSIIPDHIVFLNRKFVNWLKTSLTVRSVKATPMCHYHFKIMKFVKEMFWLMIWRFANPNSPFGVKGFFKLPIFKRFKNLQDIIICTNWKDHYFVTIQK
jgi:SAM-dependent methyltransferase